MNSMTGFGRAEADISNFHFTVEIKSVNHRFIDTRFRIPGFLNSVEIGLTGLLRSHFQRGSFDVTIRYQLSPMQRGPVGGTQFVLDETAARSLLECYTKLNHHFAVKLPPPPEVFMMTQKVFIPIEDNPSLESYTDQLESLFLSAMEEVSKMRKNEGDKLREILLEESSKIAALSKEIAKLAPLQIKKQKENLLEKIQSWQLSTPIDSSRLEWELAYYADRSDITEEIDRLNCILEEFINLLNHPDTATGRKLDFLTQEIHRELNTMGSKTNLVEITQLVVEAKGSTEKLRQQVQNVE